MKYPFAIHVHKSPDDVQVVRVLEPLDPESVPRLADTLRMLTAVSPKIVLDLTRCDYLCSTGVSTLYYYKTEVSKHEGGDLLLAFVPPFVANVLINTLGTDIIQICDTVNDALSRFGNASTSNGDA
ncbi:MAG: STAS domain-containing protein [Planctomycetota bacterium]